MAKSETDGFVERFNGTILDEFSRVAFLTKFYGQSDELISDLNQWLIHYNTERTHQGYCNRSRQPIDTSKKYLEEYRKDQPDDQTNLEPVRHDA